MAVKIHVIYNDGKEPEDFYCDVVFVSDGVLVIRGDGTYGNRGDSIFIPIMSIHKYEIKRA
jgi:hypothetical protein